MTEATAEAGGSRGISTLQEELKNKPNELGSYTRLAWALYSLSKFDEAIATFQSAYERWPSEIEVNYGLGLALKMLGDREKALESFERAEASESKSVRSSMMQTLAAEQKEYLLQQV
jgi:tetratricopeptide (TPR) repeat protein